MNIGKLQPPMRWTYIGNVDTSWPKHLFGRDVWYKYLLLVIHLLNYTFQLRW